MNHDPLVRWSHDEDEEISSSTAGGTCFIFRGVILVSPSLCLTCSPALLVKAGRMTPRLIRRNTKPLNKVNAIANGQYQQCLVTSTLCFSMSEFGLHLLSKGTGLSVSRKMC